MHIAVQQFVPEFGQVKTNRARLIQNLEAVVRDRPVDLVVLPELIVTGYQFRDRAELERLAEPVPGPTTDAFQAVARAHDLHLIVGLPERAGDRVYNAAALIGPQGVVGTYRKVHLFANERFLFDAGHEPWPVFRVGRGAGGHHDLF